MSKIRIKSNPYKKIIEYYIWKEADKDWQQIDSSYNPNSKLIGTEFCSSFFPFNVQKILDKIIEEYDDGSSSIEIEFDGTSDEYQDILSVCTQDEYSKKIKLTEGKNYLENARTLLPKFNELFRDAKPVILDSCDKEKDIIAELESFVDTTNDIIPIFILGNYSSGKSSFINALIGREILLTGDEPMTSKIYQIENSRDEKIASMEFSYEDECITINFSDRKIVIESDSENSDITELVNEQINKINGDSIDDKLRNIILYLKNSECIKFDCIDLIKIRINFIGKFWQDTSKNYVIFDTPGSNTASNNNHLEALQGALQKFSNGLPIYVSEYDKLDSMDNMKLYDEIEKMKSFDNRFALIVVNKADAAGITKNDISEEWEKTLLEQAIPKNLYSEGIFFVSSIVGLGNKREGKLSDKHTEEVYCDQVSKYSTPDSEFYKRLYVYDVMPKHIKQRMLSLSEKCEDLVYSNCGLYAIENEINTFAEKYSSYNKCQQAEKYLTDVIEDAGRLISVLQVEYDNEEKAVRKKFEKEKSVLEASISKSSKSALDECLKEYELWLEKESNELIEPVDSEQLSTIHSKALQIREKNKNLKDSESMADAIEKIDEEYNALNMANAIPSMINFIAEFLGDDSIDKEEIKAANDDLMNEINSSFKNHIQKYQTEFENESKKYWEKKIEAIKNDLVITVTQSDNLQQEKKDELKSIIINYKPVEFDSIDESKFEESSYHKVIGIGNFIIKRLATLNFNKIASKYNSELSKEIKKISDEIKKTHLESVNEWERMLVKALKDNIEEYNPNLKHESEKIEELSNKLEEFDQKQNKLNNCLEDIKAMLDWKFRKE